MPEYKSQSKKSLLPSIKQPKVESSKGLMSNIHLLHSTLGNQAVQRIVKNKPSNSVGNIVIQRLMANVEFEEINNTISKVSIERGEGTTGGAHSTAFVVFEDAAIHAAEGKNFAGAISALIDLCNAITELPYYKNADKDEQESFDDALNKITTHRDYSNPAAVSDLRKVSVVQNLIREYILLRNSLPNTLINGTSGSKGKGSLKNERTGANSMSITNENFKNNVKNSGGKLTKEFVSGLWQTFDERILPVYDSKTYRTKSDYLDAIAPHVANHLMSCMQTYPDVPTTAWESIKNQFITKIAVLKSTKLPLSTNTVPELTKRVDTFLGIDTDSDSD